MHPSESPLAESSSLFHSSPRLLEDFNRWNNSSTPEHSRITTESWVPYLHTPPSVNHNNNNSNYNINNNHLNPIEYSEVGYRGYSPLLHSPNSPILHSDSYQFIPSTVNSLQPSPIFSPTQPHYSEEINQRQWEKQQYSTDEDSSSTPSRVLTSKIRMAPYSMDERTPVYGATKPFILKLGFLLSRPDLYSDVARWDVTGTSFIVTVGPRLMEVFKELFNHRSMTSFTRQLTTYCFHHLKPVDLPETTGQNSKTISIWTHELFTRDDTSTLNRLLPRPSRARVAEKKDKVARSTLENYSERLMAEMN